MVRREIRKRPQRPDRQLVIVSKAQWTLNNYHESNVKTYYPSTRDVSSLIYN